MTSQPRHTDGASSVATNRFATGTFATPSGPAPLPQMLAAQTRMEVSLFVRNGEQLLVALIIPISILIGLTLLDIGAIDEPRVDRAICAVLAIALMGTAFTGQAISVGFDRRYGALKRLGGTPLPPAVIIGGKILAVAIIVLAQSVIIALIAALLGWQPSIQGVLIAVPVLILGTVCFSALGLLLGGTLKAELVLALANLIWFLLMGTAGLAIGFVDLPHAVTNTLVLVPSHALTTGITGALNGTFPLAESAALLAWAAVGSFLATRWFSFT